MASPSEQTFEDLLVRIEHREHNARRRALWYSLVPVAVAGIILAYTAHQIQQATAQVQVRKNQADQYKKEAARYQAQVTQLEAQLTDLRGTLTETEARLQEATELGQYIHPIDFVDMKALFSRYPQEARVLELIMSLRQQGVRWHLGGQSPTEGFDSPSFAAFILRELNLPGGEIRPGESLLTTSRRLRDHLPAVSQPRVGDVVFYPAGYVLFYFEDEQRRPFVIGMTPFGITALETDFATPLGYGRVG